MGNFTEYQTTNADRQAAYNDNLSPVQKQIDAQPKYEPSVMVNRGVQEITIGKGVTQRGVQTVNSSDFESGQKGVLGTAQTTSGAPALNINDNTVVTLPGGIQTTAAVAVRMGYLCKQPDGSFRNTDDKESE